MSVRFEAAVAKDLPQLVELLGELFEQEAEFTPDATKQEAALKLIFADPKLGRVYVARDGSKVVAMASLLFTVSTAEGGKAALLEDLIVLPGHRGRGVASSLVKFMLQEARKQGVLRLTLLTDLQNGRAHALYRKLGFADSSMKPMRQKL